MNSSILFLLAPLFHLLPVDYYYGIHGEILPSKISIKEQKECYNYEYNMYVLNWKKGNNTYYYELTNVDILNLMRAVNKEGPDETAVAWTLLTRFAWIYPEYLTFSEFVIKYAQPINPNWFPNGKLFKNYIKRITDKAKIKRLKENAKKRIEYSKYSLNQINSNIKDLIYLILENKIKNPVNGAVHFIYSTANENDSEDTARQKQLNYSINKKFIGKPVYYGSSKKGYNWFYKSKNSENFTIKIIKTNDIVSSLSILSIGIIGGKYYATTTS